MHLPTLFFRLRPGRWLLAFCGWLLTTAALAAGGPGAGRPATTGPAPSLTQALNPDGTLRAGVTGSFDARAFTMHTGPDGRPVFQPTGTQRTAGAGDEKWQDGFGLNAIDGAVYAVVRSGSNVYIGGKFKTVFNVGANNVAKWDGTAWSSLGTGAANGVDGTDFYSAPAQALAVGSAGELYVGGSFTTAGGAATSYLAKWDGAAWSGLGTGLNGTVNALALSGTDLYAGGNFDQAGSVAAYRVARWNGSNWAALGTAANNGVGGVVSALAIEGSNLYVGGSFTAAAVANSYSTSGLVAANYVAKWNGTAWSSLGTGTANGTNYTVACLAVSGSSVYVGGNFTQAGGAAAANVARWSGSAWSALGSGLNAYCLSLAVGPGGELYAAGGFDKAGGSTVNYVAKWSGSAWSGLGTTAGVSYIARALAPGSGGEVLVGGDFTQAGGTELTSLIRWSGTTWSLLGAGTALGVYKDNGATVYALAVSGTDVYIGGSFSKVGSVAALNVAKWNGTAWSALGPGLYDIVYALAVSSTGDVYAGGQFTYTASLTANRVARWNGTAWSSLGTGTANGVDGAVRALAVSGTTLYVGGEFTTAGGLTASRLARWNISTSTWSSLTGSTTTSGVVYALAVAANGDLYVGGAFRQIGGLSTERIARLSGSTWSALGNGLYGTVYALAVSGSSLYAGGSFSGNGPGTSLNSVARWDGSSWSALGSGLTVPCCSGPSAVVRMLAINGTDVYAGGLFVASGSLALSNIAKWNGTAWSSLGTGLSTGSNEAVYGVGLVGRKVYAAGAFARTGDNSKALSRFGIYDDAVVVPPVPTITGISPDTGPVGTNVTLTGTGFTGTTAVTFNGTAAPGFLATSDTRITVTVPTGATTGPVRVTTPGGQATSPGNYTVTVPPAPLVTSLTVPANGGYALGRTLDFTVTFDQAVAVTGAPTLGVVLDGGTGQAAYQSGTGTSTLSFRYTVAGTDLDLTGISLSPALALNGGSIVSTALGATPADLTLRNVPATSGIFVDGVRPVVISSLRQLPATVTATGPEVTFRVAFSERVTGVTAAAFVAVGTGGVGGTVSAVAPVGSAGSTYDVTFTGVNGDGTLKLSAPGAGALIKDAFNNDFLPSTSFSPNEVYTIIPGDLLVSTPQSASGLYATVTVATSGTLTLTGPLQVRGNTTVRTGGSFFSRHRFGFWRTADGGGSPASATAADPYYQVTGPGSFTVEAGATLSIPDPDGLSLTGATGLVQVTGTRSFSADARYIYDGDAAQVTGPGLPAQVRSLLLDNAAGLTLSQPLAVAQVLELASGTLATNGQMLTLLSDASSTALVVNTGGVVNGTATVQRYVSPASYASAGYRHLAAPVGNTTVADLATSTFTPAVNPDYNTSATPGRVSPFPTVFFYDQARLGTSPATTYSLFDRGWESPAALSSPLATGRGYTVRMAAGQAVDFVGALTSGVQPVGLARGPQAEAGWALVGNPYPAPLDWTQVSDNDRNNLLPSMWVYESTGPYAGRYRTYQNSFGNPVVPLGQAFFVRVADNQPSATLTFRNAQRLTTPDATPLLRTTADLRPQLHLALQGTVSALDDQLIVYCEAGATPAYDPAYDALKLTNSTGLNLAALAGPTALAINGLPVLTATTVVPLQVGVPAAGTYTLRAAQLLNLPAGTRVYLRDAQTGQQVDLQQQPSYSFTLAGTSAASRFFLEVQPLAPLATTTAAAGPAVQVFPNPARSQCQVLLPAGTGPATLTLYNALGQLVRQQPARTDLSTLDLTGLSAGVYTLRVQAARITSTRRLTVE